MSKHAAIESRRPQWPRRDIVLLCIGLVAISCGVIVTALATRQADVASSHPASVSASGKGLGPLLVPDPEPLAPVPLLVSDSAEVLSDSSARVSNVKPAGARPAAPDPAASMPDWAMTWPWPQPWTP